MNRHAVLSASGRIPGLEHATRCTGTPQNLLQPQRVDGRRRTHLRCHPRGKAVRIPAYLAQRVAAYEVMSQACSECIAGSTGS